MYTFYWIVLLSLELSLGSLNAGIGSKLTTGTYSFISSAIGQNLPQRNVSQQNYTGHHASEHDLSKRQQNFYSSVLPLEVLRSSRLKMTFTNSMPKPSSLNGSDVPKTRRKSLKHRDEMKLLPLRQKSPSMSTLSGPNTQGNSAKESRSNFASAKVVTIPSEPISMQNSSSGTAIEFRSDKPRPRVEGAFSFHSRAHAHHKPAIHTSQATPLKYLTRGEPDRSDQAGLTTKCWTNVPLPKTGILTPCYDHGRCRCNYHTRTADCSGNPGTLTFVPKIPGTFSTFNFSRNNISTISNQDFFVNVSREVRTLDLYNNGLTSIADGVFDVFRDLQTLLAGGNHLFWPGIVKLLAIHSLETLDVKCNVNPGPISQNTFSEVNFSRVNSLDMGWDGIGTLDMRALHPLKRLTSVYLWRNTLFNLTTTFMPLLRTLVMPSNRLFDFPKTCSENGRQSLFPKLTTLQLEFNMIVQLTQFVCLPSLKELNLHYNRIMFLDSGAFSWERFPVLVSLNLAYSESKVLRIEAGVFNNSAIKKLALDYNVVDFSSPGVDANAFGGCVNLEFLSLKYNTFSKVSDDRFHQLMAPVATNLTSLNLAQTYIRVSTNTFTIFPRLQHLFLYHNSMYHVPDGAFDRLVSLLWLNLEDNNLAVISSTMLAPHMRARLKSVELSANPFRCTCEIQWLQQWMLSAPYVFAWHSDRYYCANLPNTTLQHFRLIQQACLLGHDAVFFTIAFTCLLITFLVVFILFFRYRWHVRLWLYEACRARHTHRREEVRRQRRFLHDVFVAYAAEDLPWIQRELLPVLEGEWGLRLCVHQRDFVPGQHIVDNISDSVRDSDRLLMVLSPHFARSQWCQFELKYCQGCAMDRDDVMVLVALQETESRDMTAAMFAVLRTTTYIEWGDEDDARASFWGRLRVALADVIRD